MVIETIGDIYKLQDQERNSNVVPCVEQSTIMEKMTPDIVEGTYGMASDINDEKSEIGWVHDFHKFLL